MTGRLCGKCGGRAEYVVEPVGRYDFLGWDALPACGEHLGSVAVDYLGDDMPRVQVRFWDTEAQPKPTECTNEGCTNLVADMDGWCLNCERDFAASIGTVYNPGGTA